MSCTCTKNVTCNNCNDLRNMIHLIQNKNALKKACEESQKNEGNPSIVEPWSPHKSYYNNNNIGYGNINIISRTNPLNVIGCGIRQG
jgi:hypothetical protein